MSFAGDSYSKAFVSSSLSLSAFQPKELQMSIKDQITQAIDNITWAEDLWDSEPDIKNHITKSEWEEFIDLLYDSLDQLQKSQ